MQEWKAALEHTTSRGIHILRHCGWPYNIFGKHFLIFLLFCNSKLYTCKLYYTRKPLVRIILLRSSLKVKKMVQTHAERIWR